MPASPLMPRSAQGPTGSRSADVLSSPAAWSAWWPAVLWGSLILALSTRPGAFFAPVSPVSATASGRAMLEIAVHLTEFFVFFFLVARPLHALGWPAPLVRRLALVAVLALSFLNETVQAWVPTRTFDVHDMGVDTAAGLVAAVLSRGAGHRWPDR